MKLFICYRRKSWGHVHLLAEKLKEQIKGKGYIFVDYTGVDETDFERSILHHLRESDLVLVVVTEYTFAPDRIHNGNDWVRREIALALALKKPIVLICIDNLWPPSPSDLPEDIRDVTRMQGIPFYPEYFDAAVKRLVDFVTRVLASPALPKEARSPAPAKKTLMPEPRVPQIRLTPIANPHNQTTGEVSRGNNKDRRNALASPPTLQPPAALSIQDIQVSIHQKSLFPTRKTVLLVGLVLLIIAGSVGLTFSTISRSLAADRAIATAHSEATASVKATFTTIATIHKVATMAAHAYAKYVATNGMMSGFNAQHTCENPYEQILSPTTVSGLTKQWAYHTGGAIGSSPAVANGVVYVGSDDGNVYALDATSGSKKWAYHTGGFVFSSPAVANGMVYVSSQDWNVYAIDATSGSKKWAYQTGDAIGSSPAVANGVVYVGSYDGKLYAFGLPVPPS